MEKAAHFLARTPSLLPRSIRPETAPKLGIKFSEEELVFGAGQIIRFADILDRIEDISGVHA